MKKLLQKLGLFFLILVLIKLPFTFFQEDQPTYHKNKFSKQDYTAVFIGSSRTRYAVVPAYFDSLTREKTKSYNFGIIAGLPPHTFDWCAELMQSKTTLKYVFFELSGENLVAVDEEPWREFSFRRYSESVRQISFNESSKFHNELAISFVKPLIFDRFDDYNKPFGTDFEEINARVEKNVSSEKIQLSRLRNIRVEQEINAVSFPLNENYWNKITKLIELAESKQIRLYFFIPPRLKTDGEVETIYPIYQKLDKKYKLGAAHAEESLYNEETSMDEFHLNYKGAMRFTKTMAEALNNHEF